MTRTVHDGRNLRRVTPRPSPRARTDTVLAPAAFLAVCAIPGLVRADGGDLDPTFGTEGKVVTDFGGDEALSDVTTGPRGTILVVGTTGLRLARDILLVRYDAAGELDASFGDGGKVITDLGKDETASRVVVQRDGKILVAGESSVVSGDEIASSDFLLLRYDPEGNLDDEFGDGRVVTTNFLQFDGATGLAVGAAGKIVVGGSISDGGSASDFALGRYEKDGTPDSGFSGDGKTTLDLRSADRLVSLALQRRGEIVIAGEVTGEFDEGRDFAVARFDREGALDVSFGDGGVILTDFNEFDDVAAVAVTQSSKIIVAGSTAEFDGPDHAVLFRYNRNGSPDASFGVDGVAGGLIGADVGQDEDVSGLALQADGKIVVAGRIVTEEDADFVVARFKKDGDLDPKFGDEGLALADFFPLAIAIDRKGRIIAAGSEGGDIVLARYRSK